MGGGPTTVDVILAGSSGLYGAVRRAGGEQDGQADPIAGATVTLADAHGEVVGAQATTAEGDFRFTELGAGFYTLVVNAEGYRPAAATVVVPETGDVRKDVELVGGARLSGVAHTDGGLTVADARITVIDANGNVVGVTRTDSAGQYVISDLPEGEYTVIASGYPPAASQLRIAAGEHGQHDVRLGYEEEA